LRELTRQQECEIHEGHLMLNHGHLLISIPPKRSLSQVRGYRKGKRAIHLARTDGRKRRNFVEQHFWVRGYWVSTVGHNAAAVRKDIQDQEKGDQRLDPWGLLESQSRLERFIISRRRLCRCP